MCVLRTFVNTPDTALLLGFVLCHCQHKAVRIIIVMDFEVNSVKYTTFFQDGFDCSETLYRYVGVYFHVPFRISPSLVCVVL